MLSDQFTFCHLAKSIPPAYPSDVTASMTDLPDDTLAEILNRIGQGDDQAATRLYRHYHDFLYAYVRHRLADDAAAEDITQDVFVAVFKKPKDFAAQSKFSTWLCAIAKFKTADWWRRQKRQLPLDDVGEDVLENEPDPNWDFVARLEAAQDSEALRYCIDRLPADHRETIFWVYHQDASVDEVARRQDCPEGTVKSRLFNARKRLRDCVSRWIEGGRHG